MKKISLDKKELAQLWAYENKPLSFLEEHFGVSAKTIRRIIKEYGLIKCYADPQWLQHQHHVLKKSCKQMAVEANCSVDSIYDWMKTHNISVNMDIIQMSKKKYKENDDYFAVIDSSTKAYWLGFIMADGHVSDKLVISLSARDSNHLVAFLKDIESNRAVRFYETTLDKVYQMSRIAISSLKMMKDLKSIGFSNRKSLNEFMPNIDELFLPDFIRGYFDGDGCITFRRNHLDTLVISVTILGGQDFLQQLQKYLNSIGIITSIYQKNNDLYNLFIYKSSIEDFYNLIYAGANRYLSRKKDKFHEYLSQDIV